MAAEAGEASRRRVVVADDDLLMREGLASLLERTGFEVVGQAGDGTELVELVRERRRFRTRRSSCSRRTSRSRTP